ncbi:MAG: PKD domain-containing protein [Bacteroidetes bacterium]|nr:PKD domain-containing protein [Bacteroidota bacterium]
MNRKILLFIFILSLHPFCRGQVISQQPVNDSICLGQQEALFSIACTTPDIIFTWELSETSSGIWNIITSDMPGLTGYDNDTLQVTDASSYVTYLFRCSLSNIFSGQFLETSAPAGIIIIQPPVTDFGINQSSTFSPCYNLCAGTAAQFYDLSQDPYTVTAWQWDFDDGITSVFQNPSHLFLAPGDYTISLKTWNRFGCSSTVQKQVTVLPFHQLTITGPDIICSNQSSFDSDMYYSISPFCDTCNYEWILPDDHILYSEQINSSTIRIHWGEVDQAIQLTMRVTERNTCWQCLTGKATKEILLKSQQSPDTAFKIKRKAPYKGILIYLGEDMPLYRWGYTVNTTFQDVINTVYYSNFCDFGMLDLEHNTYWVETSASTSGECWTRSLYNEQMDLKLSGALEISVMPSSASKGIYTLIIKNAADHRYIADIYSSQGQLVRSELIPKINFIDTFTYEMNLSSLVDGVYIISVKSDAGQQAKKAMIVQ